MASEFQWPKAPWTLADPPDPPANQPDAPSDNPETTTSEDASHRFVFFRIPKNTRVRSWDIKGD